MGREHIGVRCNHLGCPTQAFSGQYAFDEWLRHSKESGHTNHSWTNTYSQKGKNEYNMPYSHPSGRF